MLSLNRLTAHVRENLGEAGSGRAWLRDSRHTFGACLAVGTGDVLDVAGAYPHMIDWPLRGDIAGEAAKRFPVSKSVNDRQKRLVDFRVHKRKVLFHSGSRSFHDGKPADHESVEATCRFCVAGAASFLFDDIENSVAIAIDDNGLHDLGIATLFALSPSRVSGSGEIHGLAGSERFQEAVLVRECIHEDESGAGVLGDDMHKTAALFEVWP